MSEKEMDSSEEEEESVLFVDTDKTERLSLMDSVSSLTAVGSELGMSAKNSVTQ